MIKQAEFVEGFINTIKDKTGFMERPFETIFGVMVPMVLFRYNKLLGILGFAAEALGYGPGWIGKKVDEHLVSTKKNGQIDLSEGNLMEAAKGAVGSILPQIKTSHTILEDIYIIKNGLNLNDFIVAPYVNKYAKPSLLGRGTGFFSKLLGGKHLSLTSALFGLLKTFAKGMIGLGIVGGLMSSMGVKLPTHQPQEQRQVNPNEQNYTNVSNNVENTLITFLDATISGFSPAFQKVNNASLKGSLKMKQILYEVAKINNTTIENLNQSKTFLAPKVIDIAHKLLPEARYDEIKTR